MKITIRHAASYNGRIAASIIMTVENGSTIIADDITDLNGKVDEDFINRLEDIVYDLKRQNKMINDE